MIDVAVVGLGFGLDFVPVYLDHPDVARVALCDPDREKLAACRERYDVSATFTSLPELLASDGWDAVHLVTPVSLHAEQAVQVLDSGRHCACAVPMGLSVDEVVSVVQAARSSGRRYMMMETAVYQREFFHAEELYAAGRLGGITFARGAHIRDRTRMPDYWQGFPPLKYATHAISPVLALLGTRAVTVHGFGSGTLPRELSRRYDNPFPLETATFALAGTTARLEVTQGCFQVAREVQEAFSVYGEQMSLEWSQRGDRGWQVFSADHDADPIGSRFAAVEHRYVDPPDRLTTLPSELRHYTRQTTYRSRSGAPVQVASHHNGSHPHLVHEFVSSIVEGRRPRVDEETAADWCLPGICAHDSALRGGEARSVPDVR